MTATQPGSLGGRVDLVVPAGIDDPRRPSGGNRYDRRLRAFLPDHGWRVRSHPVPGGWPHPDDAALTALRGILAGCRGVILIDGLIASAAADPVIEAARRRPVVVLVHLPFGPDTPALAEPESRMLAGVAAVVTTSGWTRNLLLDRYRLRPDRVHVARPGADPGHRHTSPRRHRPVRRLLCVGAVTRAKGHDVLIEALGRVPATTHDPWDCTCIGSTDTDPVFTADLIPRIARAGLQDRVHLIGPLDEASLDRAYADADLVLVPSRAETWSMVTTEALAHGLPVLASRVGGVPEAHGLDRDGRAPGMLLPAGDAPALAGALTEWLDDPLLRDRWRAATRSRAGDLPGWDRTAATVASVLRGVAGQPAAPAGAVSSNAVSSAAVSSAAASSAEWVNR